MNTFLNLQIFVVFRGNDQPLDIMDSLPFDTILEFGSSNSKSIGNEWNSLLFLNVDLGGSVFPMWDL